MKLKNAKIKILDLDLKGCLYFNDFLHYQRIALFFRWVSRLGNGIFWYVLLMIAYVMQGWAYWRQMVFIVLGCSVGTLIYKWLKQHTTRPRPYQVHQVIMRGEHPLDYFSFPSGHTLHAVMLSVVLGYIMPSLLWLMLPFTVLVALSRMVLGLHYPSDVLVGALIGASVAGLVILSANYLQISL
ncbi:phosphatase PAP2 family protein [Acinetobacter larvae]|uniref:undecaprenyl-diphosphate phosphatase n=1 Tax=Acinetobacter larvae TaxID=1789224 RepID=A0A1B2M291_9GAMM|nr:phosphatase PAP2 family protein [Acinetobacter larvae]AOA59307.1 phosphatidylglycerophosphatase [Acinetobacter larvae]